MAYVEDVSAATPISFAETTSNTQNLQVVFGSKTILAKGATNTSKQSTEGGFDSHADANASSAASSAKGENPYAEAASAIGGNASTGGLTSGLTLSNPIVLAIIAGGALILAAVGIRLTRKKKGK